MALLHGDGDGAAAITNEFLPGQGAYARLATSRGKSSGFLRGWFRLA
jgi:hypothetical protein